MPSVPLEQRARIGHRSQPEPPPISYGIPGTERATGLKKSKIYEEIAAGRLKSIKVAGRRLILHDDLVEYLRRHRQAP